MERYDRLKYELAFCALSDAFEKRKEPSQIHAEYTHIAEEFFNQVLKGLESILNLHRGYFSVEDLREIVGIIGGRYEEMSSKDVGNGIEKINEVIRNLGQWEENPEEFYKSGNYPELFRICLGIRNKYRDKSYNIFTLKNS